jgi:hypothetical protein
VDYFSLEGFCSTIELHPRRSRLAKTAGHYPTFPAGKIGTGEFRPEARSQETTRNCYRRHDDKCADVKFGPQGLNR